MDKAWGRTRHRRGSPRRFCLSGAPPSMPPHHQEKQHSRKWYGKTREIVDCRGVVGRCERTRREGSNTQPRHVAVTIGQGLVQTKSEKKGTPPVREAKPAMLIFASSYRLLPLSPLMACRFSSRYILLADGWLPGCTCGDGRVAHGRTPPPSLAVCLAYIVAAICFRLLPSISLVLLLHTWACLVVPAPTASE